MTDDEKVQDLYSRYRFGRALTDEDGRLLYRDLFGEPNFKNENVLCVTRKVENRTGLRPQETEFRNICALGPELMCLCYSRYCLDGEMRVYSPGAMRAMCRGCKNYLPLKNGEGKVYDPENFRNDFSIFKPYFIQNIYARQLYDVHESGGREKPGAYVYYITDGEFVKIGFATDPEKRLCGIQTGNPRWCQILWLIPFKREKDAKKAENDLHWVYAAYRCAGEWFDILHQLDRRRFKAEFWEAQL
jgi:hypothetical protein